MKPRCTKPTAFAASSSLHDGPVHGVYFHHSQPLFVSGVFCSKPTLRNPSSPLRTNGYNGAFHASILRPGFEVQLEKTPEEKRVDLQFNILKKRLEAVGMDTRICMPGQYNHLLCPESDINNSSIGNTDLAVLSHVADLTGEQVDGLKGRYIHRLTICFQWKICQGKRFSHQCTSSWHVSLIQTVTSWTNRLLLSSVTLIMI